MIEDLSGRLNVNAHDNSEQQWYFPGRLSDMVDNDGDGTTDEADEAYPFGISGLRSRLANWAGTRGAFANNNNARDAFRGLGYGPAEIVIPAVTQTSGVITANATTIENGLRDLKVDRYRFGTLESELPANTAIRNRTDYLPGHNGSDGLDILRTGNRPRAHTFDGGYGYTIDPFGRGGFALGRSGQLINAVAGTVVRGDNAGTPNTNEVTTEALNDPYEFDPQGRLGADSPFTLSDLDAILRSQDFDSDTLPVRLREHVLRLIEDHQEFTRALTAVSVSTDAPATIGTARKPIRQFCRPAQYCWRWSWDRDNSANECSGTRCTRASTRAQNRY